MPRGQDAPIRTGGGIDPYVVSSLQQSKQLAESRLVAAMQEAGATSRATEAERGATGRAAMQIQAQQRMQAAELEAQDRRAAESERARREDQKFTATMQEAGQTFQAEQSRLQREYQDATQKKEWDRADKIFQQMEDARRFDFEMELDSSERTTNAILSMTKIGMNLQSQKEKAVTALMQSDEEFERDKDIYDATIKRTITGFDLDKRMDVPFVAEKVRPAIEAVEPVGAFGMPFPVYITRKEKRTAGTQPDPMGVMQSLIDRTGAPISIEELRGEKLGSLEERIADNKVQAQDIRSTLAVIEGTFQTLDKKIEETSADKEKDFWKEKKAEVVKMRDSLENLRSSKRKVEASENETVGMRVRTALGIRGSSLGGRVSRLKENLGTTNYDEILNELTKPMNVYALKDITPEMNPNERRLREQYNAIILRKYPNLVGGVE